MCLYNLFVTINDVIKSFFFCLISSNYVTLNSANGIQAASSLTNDSRTAINSALTLLNQN
jgi:hypothetical protein